MTTFLIEAVVLCALFHLEVWLQTKREPARIVYSHPAIIRAGAVCTGAGYFRRACPRSETQWSHHILREDPLRLLRRMVRLKGLAQQ